MNTTQQQVYFFDDHLDWWLERYMLQDDSGAVPIVEADTEELWLISD